MRTKVQTEGKNGIIKEFFSEIVFFLVKKGSYTTFNTVKKRKIGKTWSMTKKRSSEIFGVKIAIFSGKNVIQVRGKFIRPPNSAPGLRHCITAPEVIFSAVLPVRRCNFFFHVQLISIYIIRMCLKKLTRNDNRHFILIDKSC